MFNRARKSTALLSAIFIGGSLLAVAPETLLAETTPDLPRESAESVVMPQQLRGWDYVYSRLSEQVEDKAALNKVFLSDSLPPLKPLTFGIAPKEPRSIYSKRNSRRERQNAMAFYRAHREFFTLAREKFGVPESVVLSILQIESHCGEYTGREPVFYRLARLGSAGSPENIERNFQEKRRTEPGLTKDVVEARGKWLEKTFLPHAAAVLKLAADFSTDPLVIKGSGSGAIGYPQFLPANHYQFGVDGDTDGKLDLNSAPDAILSVANYLHNYGWTKASLSRHDQRSVIWEYNHSTPYIDTVLGMAGLLEGEIRLAKQLESQSILNRLTPAVNLPSVK